MAPHEGVMNVWVAPAGDPGSARLMTHSADRPIPAYFFAPDSQSLLYIQDKAGDENFLLYQVDLASGEPLQRLGPAPGASSPGRREARSGPDSSRGARDTRTRSASTWEGRPATSASSTAGA